LRAPSIRIAAVAFAALSIAAASASAQTFTVAADDTMEKVLAGQKGKRVTVRIGTADELTGVVRLVTPQVVHLGELTGKEFYDAVIDTKSVRAVIVRAKN
jgi:hypothetical protein